jgi:hypothetical protein
MKGAFESIVRMAAKYAEQIAQDSPGEDARVLAESEMGESSKHRFFVSVRRSLLELVPAGVRQDRRFQRRVQWKMRLLRLGLLLKSKNASQKRTRVAHEQDVLSTLARSPKSIKVK